MSGALRVLPKLALAYGLRVYYCRDAGAGRVWLLTTESRCHGSPCSATRTCWGYIFIWRAWAGDGLRRHGKPAEPVGQPRLPAAAAEEERLGTALVQL